MSSTYGKNIKISLFGESHSEAIGVVIDSPPPGFKINFDEIYYDLNKRAPGKDDISTKRCESDIPHILCGLVDNVTTGTPLCAIIKNKDSRPSDYESISNLLRPGHADYTNFIKYKGFNDKRGGGHSSGRLTAPVVFAGAICKQILNNTGVKIGSHIFSIHDIKDTEFTKTDIKPQLLDELKDSDFPVINNNIKQKMIDKISSAKDSQNSVGGIIECAITGLKPGIGSPIFDNVESKIASIMFSIPGVKGIEFGLGFESSKLYGSENNDSFIIENNKIKTKTNNHGGILGGITSGMPIIFKIAFKPTPSIGLNQTTVNIKTGLEENIKITGRHDPCIVKRAPIIIENASAIAILDLIMDK